MKSTYPYLLVYALLAVVSYGDDAERRHWRQSIHSTSNHETSTLRSDVPCPSGAKIDIEITLDDNGQDTSWTLVQKEGGIVTYGGGYGGNPAGTVVRRSVCLANDGCFTFTFNDCCTYGSGSFRLLSNGRLLGKKDSFTMPQESVDFCVVGGVATNPTVTNPTPPTSTTAMSTTRLATSTTLPPTTTTREKTSATVLIIGGGAAGLAAWYTLNHQGITDVLIIEATSKLGGRAQKDETFTEFPVDLGPSFIQYPDAIRRIVEPDGVRIAEPSGGGLPNFVDYTYHDFLVDYVAPKDPSKILLGCRVISVDYTDESGIVDTVCQDVVTGEKRSFVSWHVIATVPLPILKEEDIMFNPPLPPSMTIDHPGWMWGGFKIVLEFSGDFVSGFCFPNIAGAQGECLNLNGESLFWDQTSINTPLVNGNTIVSGYILGDPSDQFTSLHDDAIASMVLDLMDETVNSDASSLVVNTTVMNWSAKRDFRGTLSSWGYDRPGTGNPSGAQSIQDKVWIAGEAFPVDGENGWVDAGIFSGDDAAKQIVKLRLGIEDDAWFWTKLEQNLGR